MREEARNVKARLDSLYASYGGSYLETDPVSFAHRFSREEDIEIVGFISASLAFGHVRQIRRSLEGLLYRLGSRPAEFVRSFTIGQNHIFRGFKHRFVDGDQIRVLMFAMNKLVQECGSLKNAFSDCYTPGDMRGSLSLFVKKIKKAAGDERGSLKFLIPDPEGGSPCKRLFLYLRWMVRRDDGIDFGIFDCIKPSELIIPLDTHIARISHLLGFTKRKSKNLSMAIEITEYLKQFDPHDPIKYDFALTRVGIVEGCRGIYSEHCEMCCLFGVCKILTAEDN